MEINYQATKTASKFHKDNSFVRLLLGPVGCGKSVADCLEVFRRGCEQEPGTDGISRSRWAIVRNTYPELKSTTIKTWQEWFPPEYFGSVKWDSPISHTLIFSGIVIEVLFIALDKPADIRKLMSLELTGIYINELQFVHKKIFETCLERVRRYPPKKSGAKITWTGVIADTNPPSTRHWIYELFEKGKPKGFQIYKYQPALIKLEDVPSDDTPYATSLDGTIYINNPDADYASCQNDSDYWLKLVPGADDETIKVKYLGDYGVVVDGRPVHPEYNDRLHYSHKPLLYNPGIELGLGFDFGLTPACAIVQLSPTGQFLVLGEIYSEHLGLYDFVSNMVLPYLNQHFPGWKNNYKSRHDPAGQTGSQTDGKNCQSILKSLNINSFPSGKNNAPTPRREGLKYHLRRLVDGEPGFLLAPKIQLIREGLMGHFQYAKVQAGADDGTQRYHEKPLKNIHSHICEGLEYIAMDYANPSRNRNDSKKKDKVISSINNTFNHINNLRSKAYERGGL